MSSIAPTLQAFFTNRLITQRDSSPETIASYRDSMRLLLTYARQQTGKQPFELDFADLDAPMIGGFLTSLEADRGNSCRTRNNRLAAIHSFFRYAAMEHPEHAHTISRVLAIPTKRYQRKDICYLEPAEIKALLSAPDTGGWLGRRDHALLLTLIQTGLRVSELIHLARSDVHLGTAAHIQVTGKGRKRRTVTLTRETRTVLDQWLRECQDQPEAPLFPTRRGGPLSRDAIEYLLTKYTADAATRCASLAKKRVTPHVLRHTNAMLLKAGGVDIATIALWLGHESITTTQIYQHTDPRLKEEAIARIAPLGAKPGRYRPNDRLLAFLEAL